MVTSGVVPGIVMLQLLKNNPVTEVDSLNYVPYIGLLLTLAACYRLATFNLDTRQTDSFIGLPTPAMSLFVIALPLIPIYANNVFFIELAQNNYFLIAVTLVLSYLMNAEISLFSLKFKSFGLKENKLKYFFLLASIALVLCLEVIAIPLVIVLYVLLSVGSNLRKKRD